MSNSWTSIQPRLTFTAVIDHWGLYIGWRHTLKDSSYNTSLLLGTEKGWKNKLYTYNCGPSLSARGTLIVGWYNPTIRGWVPHPTSWYPLHFLSFSTNQPFIHSWPFVFTDLYSSWDNADLNKKTATFAAVQCPSGFYICQNTWVQAGWL